MLHAGMYRRQVAEFQVKASRRRVLMFEMQEALDAENAALDADGRWSGPLLATYLVGSALTPVIGANLVAALGYQGFTLTLAIASFVLAVPAGIIGLLSRRVERQAAEVAA